MRREGVWQKLRLAAKLEAAHKISALRSSFPMRREGMWQKLRLALEACSSTQKNSTHMQEQFSPQDRRDGQKEVVAPKTSACVLRGGKFKERSRASRCNSMGRGGPRTMRRSFNRARDLIEEIGSGRDFLNERRIALSKGLVVLEAVCQTKAGNHCKYPWSR